MGDEWFRSTEWTDEARADFEIRLARARSHNRAQYLRIKGLALQRAGEIEGARELWLRVLDDDSEYPSLQAHGALEHLGDSYFNDDPSRAEQYYRCLIGKEPRPSGTTTLQFISLAELLIRRRGPGDVDEASELLARWVEVAESPFPNAHFRWNLAVIELATATGDHETLRAAARRALELAGRGPMFPRHQTVGLVDLDERTRERLEHLAR